MIITAEEYTEMGFTYDSEDDIEGCLKRAEYIISAVTEGRCASALAAGGAAADLVKQAAGFQTNMLIRRERELKAVSGGSGSSVRQSSTERVSIGDFSYSSGSSSSSSDTKALQTVLSSDAGLMGEETVRLLRASGCLYTGREVRGR